MACILRPKIRLLARRLSGRGGCGRRGGRGGRGGRSGSRLAAAEAVATSADEEVVCKGEKTREERDAELRGEAVLLD